MKYVMVLTFFFTFSTNIAFNTGNKRCLSQKSELFPLLTKINRSLSHLTEKM